MTTYPIIARSPLTKAPERSTGMLLFVDAVHKRTRCTYPSKRVSASPNRNFTLLVLLFLLEIERGGVHAKARARRLGTVGKDVAQMCIALSTKGFYPTHAMTGIGFGTDGV